VRAKGWVRARPNTRSCIRSFQKTSGLDATGEVDDTTYEAMLERL
jgi:peptidoglycan hydrolase-like protein with peptidoglycan-binding domain